VRLLVLIELVIHVFSATDFYIGNMLVVDTLKSCVDIYFCYKLYQLNAHTKIF
jgi:hypothetical protein